MERGLYGGGSTIVWGGMETVYRTLLNLVQGNLEGVVYKDNILQPQVLPAMKTTGPGAVHQDNAQGQGRHWLSTAAQSQAHGQDGWYHLSVFSEHGLYHSKLKSLFLKRLRNEN